MLILVVISALAGSFAAQVPNPVIQGRVVNGDGDVVRDVLVSVRRAQSEGIAEWISQTRDLLEDGTFRIPLTCRDCTELSVYVEDRVADTTFNPLSPFAFTLGSLPDFPGVRVERREKDGLIDLGNIHSQYKLSEVEIDLDYYLRLEDMYTGSYEQLKFSLSFRSRIVLQPTKLTTAQLDRFIIGGKMRIALPAGRWFLAIADKGLVLLLIDVSSEGEYDVSLIVGM